MALRDVTVDGEQWLVWAVRPTTYPGAPAVRPDMTDGWLAAKCGTRRCRIVPAPDDWQSWPEDRLADAVRAAASQPR